MNNPKVLSNVQNVAVAQGDTTYKSLPADIDTPPKHLPLKTFSQRYQIITNLGNGSFGSVVLAKRRDAYQYSADKMNTLMNPIAGISEVSSPLVAIKTMNKRLPKLRDYTKVKEVKFILSIPSHPNLVFMHEMFIDNVDFRLHIVMETMDQNLYQFMKGRKGQLFSDGSIKSILAQILAGIRHIHKFGHFHRDVKPENILISNSAYKNGFSSHNRALYTVKLADYGLARNVENKRPYTAYVSTRWYRAPEILLRQKHYSRPIDIWAFGAVAAEVSTFRPLFPGNNELDQTWKILEILGSPYPVGQDFDPDYGRSLLGGYWPEAQILASKLGFQLPYTKGVRIENIIQRPELSPLADVIRACLTWDPKLRIDVESLCRMPYFRGTVVDTNPYKEISNCMQLSSTHSSPISTPKDMLNKSEIFAGIKSLTNSPTHARVGNSISPNAPKTDLSRKATKQKTLLLKKSANQLSPISCVGSDRHLNTSSLKDIKMPPIAFDYSSVASNNSNVGYNNSLDVQTFQAKDAQAQFSPNNFSKLSTPNVQHSPGNISLASNNSTRVVQPFHTQAPPGAYVNRNNENLSAQHFPSGGFVPQMSNLSQCDSATDLIISNTFSVKQQIPGLRNSYQNYSSSIESEGLDADSDMNKATFNQRQGFYYDGYSVPYMTEYMKSVSKHNEAPVFVDHSKINAQADYAQHQFVYPTPVHNNENFQNTMNDQYIKNPFKIDPMSVPHHQPHHHPNVQLKDINIQRNSTNNQFPENPLVLN